MRWWRRACARLGARTPLARDALTAVLLAVLLAVGRIVVAVLVATRQPDPVPVPVAALATGTLVTVVDCVVIGLRRRAPRTALALAVAVVLACVPFAPVFAEPGIGLLVCAYTIGTLLPWRRAVPVLALAAAAHAVGGVVLAGSLRSLPTYFGVPATDVSAVVVASVSGIGIAGLVGAYVQVRRAYTGELVARAAAEERGRIARELHDIAAHDLSAIVVQAGAADRLVERDPDAARRTLHAIRRQGRDTLTSLRRLVGILREDDADGRSPAPGLRRLPELVAGARAAGLSVALDPGPVPVLPRAVDLAAYRVVQEGLTNAAPARADRAGHRLGPVRAGARRRRPERTGRPSGGARVRRRAAHPGSGPAGRWRTGPGGDAGAGRAGRRLAAGRPGAGRRLAGGGPAAGGRHNARVTVRIVVADDQAVVRAGFRTVLESEPDLTVVGEAGTGEAAVRVARQLRPDLVLMDVRMPGGDGITATAALAGPGVADPLTVLVVTTFDLDEYVFAALRSGASGFLLKDVEPDELVAAVRVVAAGQGLVAPQVTRRLIAEFARTAAPRRPPAVLATLTDREREILPLVARGASNAEIAAQLVLAPATVKTHVGNLLTKLGCANRVQAVVFAHDHGLITPRP